MATKPLPSSFISSAKVNERTKLYKEGIFTQTSPSLAARHGEEYSETRWIWYSKKQVEEWYNELQDLEGSGIRIYLGQKEEPLAEDGEPEEHEPKPGQLCIMLVLTKQRANDPELHDNIVYENLPDFPERENLTKSQNYMNLNAGSYSPPLKPRIMNDYPND
jgi:hypothetical protein